MCIWLRNQQALSYLHPFGDLADILLWDELTGYVCHQPKLEVEVEVEAHWRPWL